MWRISPAGFTIFPDFPNDRVRLEFTADVHRVRAVIRLSDIPETVLEQDFFHKVCNIFFVVCQ